MVIELRGKKNEKAKKKRRVNMCESVSVIISMKVTKGNE